MGSRSRNSSPRGGRKQPEVIHIRRFMGGRMTPDEVWRSSIKGKCIGCGGKPAIRIRVLMPLEEMVRREPELVGVIAARAADGRVPTIPTKYGPLVCVSNVGACDNCRATAEKEAAKGPSWAVVEISTGPGKEKFLTQVPDKLEKAKPTVQ